MNNRVLCSLLLVLLTACSQEVPFAAPPSGLPLPAAASTDQDDCSASSVVADGSLPSDNKVFAVTLIDKPVCSSATAATAVVKWDVSTLNAAAVSIYVSSPGNPKKLWVDGSSTGEETTGKWVFENTCFSLRNKGTGRALATRLVGAIPCTR